MTKSEMRVGFRLLGNHKYITSKISLNKQKYQTEKKDVSPTLSHLHGQTWSVNFEYYSEITVCVCTETSF